VAIGLRHSSIGKHWFGGWRAHGDHDRRRYEGAAIGRLILLVLAIAFLMPQSIAQTAAKEVRRVLFLNIFEPLSSPGVAILDQAIVAGLEKSPYQIELYSEDLDIDLFPDKATQREIRDTYIRRYRDRQPDLIIAVGPEPLRFLLESHHKAFPGIPIIFCGSTEEMLEQTKPDSHFTGVWGVATPDKTLLIALQLRPSTRHVAVVGGSGVYDRALESVARQSFRNYESKLDFIYLTDLVMPALLERLKHLPNDTIVYHTAITQDAAGSHFIDATQSVPLVAQAASAPVFVVDDVDVGRGSVGGHVLSFAAQGQVAADIAVRVLKGEKPENIPVVQAANVDMFDWRALQRWGIKERDLPPGSVILHRRLTLWESYKWYIMGGLSLILFEAILILGLLWQRAGRRKAETELVVSSDRLRLAVEAGKSVGWDWDVKSGQERRFGALDTMFGISTDNHSGNIREFRNCIYPADRERVWKAIAEARTDRKSYSIEFRVVRTDGVLRWVTARGEFYFTHRQKASHMLGMLVDITERKLAEEALSSLTGRLIEAQEEERRRIAREIHDDYQQRLAMLAIDLEDLAENIGNLNGDASGRLRGLWNYVSELAIDLHSLSHRLHSSTLESLGLVAGIEAFCEEFTDQQEIQIKFDYKNVPLRIPGDAALCLFRIVQEGLRNIKRHSGATEAEVRLEGMGENLHLTVSDRGKGFDPNVHSGKSGIGIRSMEERLRLLGGHLQIYSQPMEGARVEAWLRIGSPVAVCKQFAGR
jgi:PAS domain S-box-containing protein